MSEKKKTQRNAAKRPRKEEAHKPAAPFGGKYITKGNLFKLVISVFFLTALIFIMIVLNRPDPEAVATSASKQTYVTARVTAVLSDNAEPDNIYAEGRRAGTQELEIQILEGAHKGERLYMTNYLSALANVDVGEGDRIIVRIVYEDNGDYYPTMHNYDRGIVLGLFVVVFVVMLAVIGGKKGIMALLGLIFTLVCIWFLLIPLTVKGYHPILAGIVVVILTSAVSILVLDGFTRKSLSAILGCIAGVLIAGLSAGLVGILSPMNGFNMGEAENLMLQATYDSINISGLLVCGILIASLGAVMDVAMSIASAVHELHVLNPTLSSRRLFASGMNIGRDAMGTMANTLILAFAGSSLNTLILVRAYGIPYLQLVNTDFICIEILRGIAGSLGIIMTVPLVAAFSAWIINRTSVKSVK